MQELLLRAEQGRINFSMLQNIWPPKSMMSSFKDTKSNFECGASEDFDGHAYPVFKYGSAGDVMGVKTSSHITLYNGDKGLPIALIVDGTAMGVHSVSTQRITYDPSITIAPPK